MTERDECWALAVITLAVLAMVIMHPLTHTPTPDCKINGTWSTASGVRACAIHEGERS